MKKEISSIIKSQQVMMGSIEIGQPLPSPGYEQVSPFILLHHGEPKNVAPGEGINVPPHPHRGFEPVSFVFSGELEHNDSLGNKSIIGAGGVQWTTAGSGIIHSEKASEKFNQQGGEFEMIQLWINLPKKLKMIAPSYQGYNRDDIPFYIENNARVNVIAGELNGKKGPFNSITNITALTIETEAHAEVNLQFPEDKSVIVYHLHGNVSVNEQAIDEQELVAFEQHGTDIKINAKAKSLLLVLAGEPIDEPLATYGPFVMNTQEELSHALSDFRAGKMGELFEEELTN